MPEARPAELPVFARWLELVDWLLAATGRFPKHARFPFAQRIENLALDVVEDLVEARYTRQRQPILRRANLRLEKLRVLVRLAHGRRYLATSGYEHAARGLDEVGRMLGGWLRQARAAGEEGAER